MRYFVYVLFDPRKKGLARYIGVTANPRKRLLQHICEAKRGDRNYRCNWIRRLLRDGVIPSLDVVDETNEKGKESCERRWISLGRSLGWDLTNGTDGGDGCSGYVFTDEVRRRMSEALLGRKVSKETKQKIGVGNKGKIRSQRLKARWSSAMKRHWSSPEFRVKMSLALRGRVPTPMSEETRRKISVALKGRKPPLELRRHWSEKRKGRKLSEETKRKVSSALTGRPVSEKTRALIAEKARARWASKEFRGKVIPALRRGSQRRWKTKKKARTPLL